MSKIVQTRTNIKNRTRKALQRGFSNVQIAIGILVTVILLLGALSGYQYIQQSKVNNEVAMLTDLRAATIRYGQFTGPFSSTNLSSAILKNLNFFQGAGLTITGTDTAPVINNQWGGTVTPSIGTINSAGDSIDFTFTGVPNSACKDIGTKVDNIAAIVSIDGTPTKLNGAPTNPAEVGTKCKENVTIIYTIAR